MCTPAVTHVIHTEGAAVVLRYLPASQGSHVAEPSSSFESRYCPRPQYSVGAHVGCVVGTWVGGHEGAGLGTRVGVWVGVGGVGDIVGDQLGVWVGHQVPMLLPVTTAYWDVTWVESAATSTGRSPHRLLRER